MRRYYDSFIEQQRQRGIPVTKELIEFNAELKIRDEARRRYVNRPLRCKLGLHNRVQAWYGGGYPKTCSTCWRHEL